MTRARALAISTVVGTTLTVLGLRYPENPPLAHTGGFGEPTCHECHNDSPLNDPSGSLALEGLPVGYRPEQPYRIAVVLSHPGLVRGGFQLSARHLDGPWRGRQAGAFRPVDDAVEVTGGGALAIEYAHHAEAAAGRSGTVRWAVEWRAPASGGGAIGFHAAANAANDDDSELGDFVFAGNWRTERQPDARIRH